MKIQTAPPKRPNVRNFTVIPICGTKLKHIELDHADLINLFGQMKMNGTIQVRDDYPTHYAQAENKINRLTKTDPRKFWHVLLTDSASACVMFSRPKVKGLSVNYQQIREKYEKTPEEGGYVNECGVDPGERTKYACVR